MRPASPRVRGLALAAITVLVAMLMLPNFLWLAHSHAITTWISALVMPVVLLSTLFALLGRWPWLACLALAPFALLAPLEAFYVATYDTPSSAQVMAVMLETNVRVIHEFLGRLVPLAILAPLLGLSIALVAAWLCFRSGLRWRGRVREWTVAIVVAVPLLSMAVAFMTSAGSLQDRSRSATFPVHTLVDAIRRGYPFGVIQRIATYRNEWTAMQADTRRFATFSFHAHRAGPQPHRRQVYVLVIGESDTRSHWQMFGYARPTNPELSKLANVIPITRMVTPWSVTIASVPVMLTRKPITSPSPRWKEPSFLPAMQEAGYDTWWISNQYPIGMFDSPIAAYAYEARHVVWVNHSVYWNNPGAYDGALVPVLRKALQSSNQDMFIVLHMMGSHFQYDYRYPPAFARFKPVQSDAGSAVPLDERIGNSYDNSIAYTDHVLAEVIHALQETDAITALWFQSDHGDVLPSPTCDKQGHGIGTWHEFETPAFFWYSNAFAASFPRRLSILRDNAGKRALTANTFASMLDLAGVDFPGLDHGWSLFSPEWRYHTRWVSQLWKADFDHSVLGKHCGVVIPAPDSSSPTPPIP